MRCALGEIHSLSLLSAGELDLLVTVGHIAAQQTYLQRKFSPDNALTAEPSGWVFIDEVDAHLHPQWQQKIMPVLLEMFPTIRYCITTHSPFVLRSLPRDQSIVVRLPDGQVYDEDWSAMNIESILETVFEVPSRWEPETASQLERLKELARSPEQEDAALELYTGLAKRSNALRSACDRIIAFYGNRNLRDRVADKKPEQTPNAAN
jgi:predicted ATP-binding protein involved in virulence